MKKWLRRLGLLLLWGLVIGGLFHVLRPRNWIYYTDGISVREAAKDADIRLILWEKPTPLEPVINDLPNNIEPVISADGDLMVFARGKAKENAELYYAERVGADWGEPRLLVNVNSAHDELGPELSSDGKLLYFYSDRPGGAGAYDIWVSPWSESGWAKPVPLGTNVNSTYNEYDPALAPGDDRLYFSSNRPKNDEEAAEQQEAWRATLRELVNITDYDIFRADQFLVNPDETEEAEEKPDEVLDEKAPGRVPAYKSAERVAWLNTDFDEGQVDFTYRGDFLYFSSNREGGKGGFDIYRSRLIHGEIDEPELVGSPISTPADDMDPALWLEGYSLAFSSNRDSDSGKEFKLYKSLSREVVAKFENAKLALIWEWIKANWWMLALLLLLLLALYFLVRWYVRSQSKLSLTAKCVAGSVLLHVLILFLLSLWLLTAVIIEQTRGPMEVEINEAALAREKMSTELREEVTELKKTHSDIPMPQRIERVEMPNFTPKVEPVDIPLDKPAPHEFVLDYQKPSETIPEVEIDPVTELQHRLPSFETAMITPDVELPEKEKVETEEPVLKVENKLQVEQVKQATPVDTKPVKQTSKTEVAKITPPPKVKVENSFKPIPVKTDALPEITWTEELPELELAPEDAALETPDVKPVETIVKEVRANNQVKVEQFQKQVDEWAKAVETLTEPVVINPEVQQVIDVKTTVKPAPVSAEHLPEIEFVDTLPPLEVKSEVESLETPNVKPVEKKEMKLAVENNLELQKIDHVVPELKVVKPKQVKLDVKLLKVEEVVKLEIDQPLSPIPLNSEKLPEFEMAQVLPEMELEEDLDVEIPQPEAVEVKDADLAANKTLEEVKQESEVLVQADVEVKVSDVTITQVVTQVDVELDALLAKATPVEQPLAARVKVTNPELEHFDFAFDMEMESQKPTRNKAPDSEKLAPKTLPEVVQKKEHVLASLNPVHTKLDIASAIVPRTVAHSGSILAKIEVNPELFNLPEEGDRIQTELPEFELGNSIDMESRTLNKLTYMARDPKVREKIIEQLGGNDETEAAISRALQFFIKTQEPDGHWDIKKHGGEAGHEVAATALAMLCFMGHGGTHTQEGPYKDAVSRAVKWLKKQQDASGRFKAKDMYDHGIASIAMAEAYAMTEDIALKGVVRRSSQYIVNAQHKRTGSWRYQPNDEGDMSVFGWQLMALKSARMAGVDVPADAFDRTLRWFDRVGGGKDGGLYGYQGKSPQPAMVAEGMFCQQLLGLPPTDKRMVESAKYIETKLPNARKKDYYYWYYGCLSLYQHQGPIWEKWNDRMREILLTSQDRKGAHTGSWNPSGDNHGNRMGRIVSTALATLSLEVYYRYLPMYGGLEKKAK